MKILICLLFFLSVQSSYAYVYRFKALEYPPYSYEERGRAFGIVPEIVELLCRKIQIDCNTEIVPFRRALTSLEQGEIHGMLSLVKSSDRDAYATFFPILKKINMVFITSDKAQTTSQISDLKDWTVGTIGESNTYYILTTALKEEKIKINIVGDQDAVTLINKLQNGRYGDRGGIILNEDVFNFHVKRFSINGYRKQFVLKSDELGIYFSRHNVDAELLSRFNMAFEQLKQSGQLKTILDKHITKL